MLAKLLWVVVTGTVVVMTSPSTGLTKASSVEIFPLEKVKRGQKGYGLTTFHGTTPERFTFEVVDVNRNFLPKMDIILVKSEDPKIQVTGFWRGMSGSPLFIEDKLACAFSYGFRFNKLAIGGCTPLVYMKNEGLKPLRGSQGSDAFPLENAKQQAEAVTASIADWLARVPDGDVGKLIRRGPQKDPFRLQKTLPQHARQPNDFGMEPAAVPLALSGFTPLAFEKTKELLAGFPLEPMQAGGTGNPNEGPTSFQMGASIAVQLVRGDMSAAATGTVSFVDGNDVLAFGHPMFQAGEIYAPVAAAHVHTVIPSAQSPFVLASPMRELGSLTQDRQSTIAADTSLRTKMIPMHIELVKQGGEQIGTFNVEILDNRFFTASFAGVVATNAASLYLPDRGHTTLRMKSRVQLKGHKPLVFTDFLYSPNEAAEAVTQARGLRVLGPLLSNPFGRIQIQRVDLTIEVDYSPNVVSVTRLTLPQSELIPGEKNFVDVHITPFRGDELVQRIPFDVPRKLAGNIVRLEVTPGDAAAMYIAPPKTAKDLVEAFRTLLPGSVYAVTLFSAAEAAAIDGTLIQDLPASALNRLRTAAKEPELTTRRAQSRSIFPAKNVIDGSAELLVKVADLPRR